MIVPTPYDAVAFHKLSAVELDAGIKDAFMFLMSTFPRVHAYHTAGLVVPSTNVYQLISMAGEGFDTDAMHDPAANNSRITFTTAGTYDVDFYLASSAGALTTATLQTCLNANGVASTNIIRTQEYSDGVRFAGNMSFRFIRAFNAGDYVEFFVKAQGATTTLATPSLGTRCFAKYICD